MYGLAAAAMSGYPGGNGPACCQPASRAATAGAIRVLPDEADAGVDGVIVGTTTDIAVVAHVNRGALGDVGRRREADHGRVAPRRRAEDGEGVAGSTGKG